jgi:twitching motility protein PilT
MIDRINETREEHIMSVEDPIEFLHHHKKCIVNQREVNQDTKSFAQALKHVLRQDPDVILVGEMRDLETISLAVTAAETGHLVFGTLHTQDAPQTVDRVIDVFPPHQQHQVRAQFANALQGAITQTLIPRRDGEGRVVACEVLVPTPGVTAACVIVDPRRYYQHETVLQRSKVAGAGHSGPWSAQEGSR